MSNEWQKLASDVIRVSSLCEPIELIVNVLNGDVIELRLPPDAPVSELHAQVALEMKAPPARMRLFHGDGVGQLMRGTTLRENFIEDGSELVALVDTITEEEVCKMAGIETINEQHRADGKTATFRAAANGDADLLADLLSVGADPSIADKFHQTPANGAAFEGHANCLVVLWEAGLDLGKADRHGDTPAHSATVQGHSECLKVLQEAGVNLGKPNSRGRTPLQQATVYGHAKCVALLKDFGY